MIDPVSNVVYKSGLPRPVAEDYQILLTLYSSKVAFERANRLASAIAQDPEVLRLDLGWDLF